jgi:hypothetical protein
MNRPQPAWAPPTAIVVVPTSPFFDGHVERRDRKQIDTFYLGAATDDLWEPYK